MIKQIIAGRFIILLLSLTFFVKEVKARETNIFNYPLKTENFANIQKIIPQPSIIHGNFEQIKTINDSNRKFISTGKFIFSKENGLYWHNQKPFSSIIVFTKNGLLKIEDGTKKIISADDKPFFQEFSQIFQSIFSGNPEKLKDNFDIFFTQDNKGWVLGLKSNNEIIKNIITEITIKGNQYIKEIELKEQFGDITLIKMNNVILSKKLTQNEENYFKF